MPITYTTTLEGVDWRALRQRLIDDNFDNGRTAAQYQISFSNSAQVIFAWDGPEIVGKARALSDGVCNAYIVDVWTYTPYRRQGIATNMMRRLLARLAGQHIYLFSDDAVPFYTRLGFSVQESGLGLVVGRWLENETRLARYNTTTE
jgi:predicted GNAT family acetyltransferase